MLKNNLFIYEHGVCGEEIPDGIAVEGIAMFKSMLYFSKYYNLVSFVRPEFRSFFSFDEGNFDSALESSDSALIVAPENDFTLYNLTERVEKAGVENLGSSTKALKITSDKWLLYKKLKGRVNVPATSKKPLGVNYLVKPRVSCGGEGIRIGGKIPEGFIAQEYVEGNHYSVSFFVHDGDIHVLSVNEQILENFEYKGAVIPADAGKDAVEEAIRAVELIEGLNGYVGVDIVSGREDFVIEINARLTTPSSVFSEVYGKSYADMRQEILEKGELKIKPLRKIMMVKGTGGDGFVNYKGHSINLKTLKEF